MTEISQPMPEMELTDADRIAEELEIHRNRLLRDFVMLDKLYDSVLEQYRELTVLTEAGQWKLEEDTSAERDLRERFEKRLHDLKLSRMEALTLACKRDGLLEDEKEGEGK